MTAPTDRDEQAPGEVEGWRKVQGGFCHDSGFWLLVDPRTGVFEIQHGGEDNAILPLLVLKALLAHHGLHIVGAEEASAIRMLKLTDLPRAVRILADAGAIRVAAVLSELAELARRAGKEGG